MNHEVIVIGAGPVGLTAALLLARHGVRVAILDKNHGPANTHGAVSVDDESLRIWQSLGLEKKLRKDWDGGSIGQVMCEYHGPGRSTFLKLYQHESDLGYPHAVAINLEGIAQTLWNEAEEEPSIRMLTGCRMIGIEQDNSRVQITYREHSGAESKIRGLWAIACDGGKSFTRSQLDIKMHGETLANPWLIAQIEDEDPQKCVHIQCDPKQPAVTIPMPQGVRRIECQLPRNDTAPWIDNEDEVRNRLRGVWPDIREAKILDVCLSRFEAKIADRWRVGRVFLCGDAAHLAPPFAGQGLAAGLRDAANLFFKLTAVHLGCLPDSILDTYEQERRPHQERMLKLAMRLGRIMAPRSRWQSARQQFLIRSMMSIPPVRRHFQLRGPGIRPVIREGFLRRGGKSGHYFPQPWVSAGGNRRVRFDALLGPRMTWVAIGKDGAPGRVYASSITSGDTVLVENRDFYDEEHQLQRKFGTNTLVLIRPDRVIHTHCAQIQTGSQDEMILPWNTQFIQDTVRACVPSSL